MNTKLKTSDYPTRQKSHCNCIVCGSGNPISLGLKFNFLPGGTVSSQFTGSSLFQGYKGIIHGGIISTLLDAAMTHCLFYQGIEAVTGDLQIRFLKPVPCNASLDIQARVVSAHSVLYKLESELLHGDQLLARGRATFMKTD